MKKKLFMGLVTVITVFSMMFSTAFAATSFDAFEEFDTESATGENGPWLYYVTTDEGESFTPCTVLEAMTGLTPWHPVAGNWTGVGLNADVPDFVELNTDGKGGSYGALSFKAPEDGTYNFSVNLKNPWGQPAELLHARLNGDDIFTVEPSTDTAEVVSYEATGVELEAGDEVFFFAPSTVEGEWVSAYVQVNVTLEAAEAEDVEEAEEVEAVEAVEEVEVATETPKTGVVEFGLLYAAGAVVTGALALKRRKK